MNKAEMIETLQNHPQPVMVFEVVRVPSRFKHELQPKETVLYIHQSKEGYIFHCRRLNENFRLPLSAIRFVMHMSLFGKDKLPILNSSTLSYRP